MSDAIAALKDVEDEDGAHRAQMLLGELLIRSGKRGRRRRSEEGDPVVQRRRDQNTDPEGGVALTARCAQLLRLPRQSNDLYNKAERVGAKKMVEPLLWRTELFLDKCDPGNAGSGEGRAEGGAERSGRARGVRAREAGDAMDFDGAEAEINQALEVNPYTQGLLRAGWAGAARRGYRGGGSAADLGLKTNPNHGALEHEGGDRFLADDQAGFRRRRRVSRLTRFSTVLPIVGSSAPRSGSTATRTSF
ncbi:MAG: hypothetical protein R3B70_20885 [Polyangiaceae bacterium]